MEAVDICLPTDLHAPVAIEALRAGKHMLVEKPMALTGASADEMVNSASENRRILMAGQVLRFSPAYQNLRDLVNSAQLGPIRSAISVKVAQLMIEARGQQGTTLQCKL